MIKKSIRKNENYNAMLTLLAWSADVTIGVVHASLWIVSEGGLVKQGRDKQAIEHTCIYMESVSCLGMRQFSTGCLAN